MPLRDPIQRWHILKTYLKIPNSPWKCMAGNVHSIADFLVMPNEILNDLLDWSVCPIQTNHFLTMRTLIGYNCSVENSTIFKKGVVQINI